MRRLASSALASALLLANGIELKANENFLLNKVVGTNNYEIFKSSKRVSRWGARNFKQWFMTDFLQCLIDEGVPVYPIFTSRGWLEFDTNEDYEKYSDSDNKEELKKFINLNE